MRYDSSKINTTHNPYLPNAGLGVFGLCGGTVVETLTLPTFNGPVAPVFKGPVLVDLPAGDFKTQLAALSTQPGLGYLNDLAKRSDVKWQEVKLANDSWNYKTEGLTPAGAALLTAAVAIATGGAGAGIGASLTGTSGVYATMANAAFASLASQASVILVNNKGNIGKTLKDLGKSEVIKNTLAAALTAGALEQISQMLPKTLTQSTAFTDKLTVNLVNASAKAVINTAVVGGSLEDQLKLGLGTAIVDTAHGQVASKIKLLEEDYYIVHKLAHALAGCVAASAVNAACRDGAVGAAVGEMVATTFADSKPGIYATQAEKDAYNNKVLGYSKIIAGGVAAYAGGNASTAISSADTAVQNNYLTYSENERRKQAKQACDSGNAQGCADLKAWDTLDTNRDATLKQVCTAAPTGSQCKALTFDANKAVYSYYGKPNGTLDEQFGSRSNTQELQRLQVLLASTGFKDTSKPINKEMVDLLIGIIPIVGTTKAVIEAQTPFDYAMAGLSGLGDLAIFVGAPIKAAKALYDAGKIAEATEMLKTANVALVEAKDALNIQRTAAYIENNIYKDGANPAVSKFMLDVAVKASTNEGSTGVMVLGKYIEGNPQSYERIADAMKATYFAMGNVEWKMLESQVYKEGMDLANILDREDL